LHTQSLWDVAEPADCESGWHRVQAGLPVASLKKSAAHPTHPPSSRKKPQLHWQAKCGVSCEAESNPHSTHTVRPGWSVHVPPTQSEHCSVFLLSNLPTTHPRQLPSNSTWPGSHTQSARASLPASEAELS